MYNNELNFFEYFAPRLLRIEDNFFCDKSKNLLTVSLSKFELLQLTRTLIEPTRKITFSVSSTNSYICNEIRKRPLNPGTHIWHAKFIFHEYDERHSSRQTIRTTNMTKIKTCQTQWIKNHSWKILNCKSNKHLVTTIKCLDGNLTFSKCQFSNGPIHRSHASLIVAHVLVITLEGLWPDRV